MNDQRMDLQRVTGYLLVLCTVNDLNLDRIVLTSDPVVTSCAVSQRNKTEHKSL